MYYDKSGMGNQVCTAKQNISFSHTLLWRQLWVSLHKARYCPSSTSVGLAVSYACPPPVLLNNNLKFSTFHHSNLFHYSSGQELFDVQVINPSHPWAPDWPSQVNLLLNSLFMFQLLFHKTFNASCSFLSSVSMRCNFNELKILFQLVVSVVQL